MRHVMTGLTGKEGTLLKVYHRVYPGCVPGVSSLGGVYPGCVPGVYLLGWCIPGCGPGVYLPICTTRVCTRCISPYIPPYVHPGYTTMLPLS